MAKSESTLTNGAKVCGKTRAARKQKDCGGVLRGHLYGHALEGYLQLRNLARLNGGKIVAGPKWLAKKLPCSLKWARKLFHRYVQDGWLVETTWGRRAAHEVRRSHLDWAIATGATNCSLLKAESHAPEDQPRGNRVPEMGNRVPSLGNSPPRNSQGEKELPARPSVAEDPSFKTPLKDPDADRSDLRGNDCLPREEKRKDGFIEKMRAAGDEFVGEFLNWCEQSDGKRYPDWWSETLKTCDAIGYSLDEKDPLLGFHFLDALEEMYGERGYELRSGALSKADFCTLVINLLNRRGQCWPPSFQQHRTRLRNPGEAKEQVSKSQRGDGQ